MTNFDQSLRQVQGDKVDEILKFQDKVNQYAGNVEDFKPTQDYIVVLQPTFEKKTASGILKSEHQLNKEFDELPKAFEVVNRGPSAESINVGQYILCTRTTKVPVKSNKEGFEVAVTRMYDVIGVFDKI